MQYNTKKSQLALGMQTFLECAGGTEALFKQVYKEFDRAVNGELRKDGSRGKPASAGIVLNWYRMAIRMVAEADLHGMLATDKIPPEERQGILLEAALKGLQDDPKMSNTVLQALIDRDPEGFREQSQKLLTAAGMLVEAEPG